MGLAERKIVARAAEFPDDIDECVYGKRVMLTAYGEDGVASLASLVAVFHECRLLQDLPCVREEFVTLVGDRDAFIGAVEDGDAHFFFELVDGRGEARLPVVLFPGGASQVVPGFDAMLFMTLVSGRNPNYLIDEQVRGGALVRALNMEAIPTAYQLINSGKRTTVEYISGTMPVPANKPKLSMVNSIAAELMGMRYVYLEAGSGAEEPVPVEHIAYTRKATEMTIITGGGIKDPQTAAVRVAAGANIIVTGTLWEKVEDPVLLKEFSAAIHVKG